MNFHKKARILTGLGLAIPAILLVMACGPSSSSGPAPAAGPSEASAPTASEEMLESMVSVRFSDGQLSPETIQVKHGEEVTLGLETDRPGTFHIHGYDLEQEAKVGEVTDFQFLANATGRFRINFHGQAAAPMTVEEGKSMGVSQDLAGASGDHGTMDHGPMESAVPVELNVTATVVDGGVRVEAEAEGWRWAPEQVNGANSDGAGHAHIYANGVKLSRMYGPNYFIQSLPPGSYEIKVALNSNDHSELTWEGNLLEASTTVTILETNATDHQGGGPEVESIVAESPMSVEIRVHEDALGGYNLEVIPSGFEFSTSVDEAQEPGKGFAALSINGEEFNRLYEPWLQVPAQGEGMHTFEVALFNDDGQPYHFDGKPVAASEQVRELGGEDGPATASSGGHHGGGAGQDGNEADHHGADSDSAATVEELEVGYLEVLP